MTRSRLPLQLLVTILGTGCQFIERFLSPEGEAAAKKVAAEAQYRAFLEAHKDPRIPNIYGGSPHPFGTQTAYTQLAVGTEHLCAIRMDGEMDCYGSDHHGETHPPVAGPWDDVWANRTVTCGLRSSGDVVCWGTLANSGANHVPANWPFDPPWAEMVVGGQSCGLDEDGVPTCFVIDPVNVEAPTPLHNLKGSSSTVCAQTATDSVVCWGMDGRLRDSYMEDWTVPSGAYKDFAIYDTGVVCGLRLDSSIVCWGRLQGVKNTVEQIPNPEMELTDLHMIGLDNWCGRDIGGVVHCRYIGGLQAAPPLEPQIQVASGGGSFACGRDAGGIVRCWGLIPTPGDI